MSDKPLSPELDYAPPEERRPLSGWIIGGVVFASIVIVLAARVLVMVWREWD